MMCRLLDVSPSGFYAWCKRLPSDRTKSDAALVERIRAIHERSRATYGMPRVHAELAADGVSVGKKRVARLMKLDGIEGVSPRKSTFTTKRDPNARPAPDLVDREFTATEPNQLWVADITYVPTWTGFLYLAVVIDVWSRRVVGWSMETHLRTELVLEALDMAIGQRRPRNVIHHSDQGCQGEFNRSLQHLNAVELQWVLRNEGGQVAQDGFLCVHQDVRRQDAVNIDNSFGRPSREVCRAGMRRSTRAYRSRLERGGSARMAAWHRTTWSSFRGATCRLPNARRSRSYTPRTSAFARLLGRSSVRHRRFRASCEEMRRRVAADLNIAPRRHSGMQS
jgi:hypothetical protein